MISQIKKLALIAKTPMESSFSKKFQCLIVLNVEKPNKSSISITPHKVMTYQRNLAPFISLTLVNIFAFVRGQLSICDTRTFANNSLYDTNLNTLLSSMSTNIDDNGFYNASKGQKSERVYAVALCRGDDQLKFCRSCVKNATSLLQRSCPNIIEAILWDEFCMLRYSDSPTYGIADNRISHIRWIGNSTSPWNSADISTLLINLPRQAANGGSLRKVAYGNSGSVYALLQCTPDLSSEDCFSCLTTIVQRLMSYFSERVFLEARVLAGSCLLRYDVSSIFYNETRLQELADAPSPAPVPMQMPQPLAPSRLQIPGNRNNSRTRITIITVIVVSGFVGVIILFLIVYLTIKRKRKSNNETELEGEEMTVVRSLQCDFDVIKAATNNFSDVNKLGQGGFGAVYKGKLPNGQEIAVKRLAKGSCQGDLEFKNEVVILVKLQHRNLVRLLGFSLEGTEKLLVYEFVQNASLDHHLFDSRKRKLLDWDRRHQIIGGIARGILYLHEDSRLRIIHRDLKASNILLDGDLNPKIADFGLARLFVSNETQGSTSRIVGTYGYMAPEYAMRGHFSIKSDVFSFGVLLLEIISGQKNNCFRYRGAKMDIISSAWENWQKDTTTNLVDPLLMVGSSVPQDVLRCIHIGLLCVQENATIRPTMASVVLMLNSLTTTLAIPSHPAFYEHDDEGALPLREFSWGEDNFDQPSKKEGDESGNTKSINEMSISEFYGR